MEPTGEVVRSSDDTVAVMKPNAPPGFNLSPRSETSTPPPETAELKSNAPPGFNITPRSETSIPPPETTVSPPPPPPQNPIPPTEGFSTVPMKRKRGRPRKHGLDGATVTLSPNPISSAPPTTSHVIDFSVEKRGKVKPVIANSFIRPKYQVENLGEWAPPSVGNASFTPHIITVHVGEDVTKKIISFSQQGSLAICVLCANGIVSSVTLSQPDSSGGTLTYEGRFEILSLTGSFMPSDSDGTRSRTGGMSVSLASPDGRVIGGGVAGLLIAATPIQVVVGSFLAGINQYDQKLQNQNHNFMATSSNADDYRMIRPLHIRTWSPPFHSDPTR